MWWRRAKASALAWSRAATATTDASSTSPAGLISAAGAMAAAPSTPKRTPRSSTPTPYSGFGLPRLATDGQVVAGVDGVGRVPVVLRVLHEQPWSLGATRPDGDDEQADGQADQHHDGHGDDEAGRPSLAGADRTALRLAAPVELGPPTGGAV